jgi:hypothetical protein
MTFKQEIQMHQISKTTVDIDKAAAAQEYINLITRKDRLTKAGVPAGAAKEILRLCKGLNESEFQEVLTTHIPAAMDISKGATLTSEILTSADMTMQILKAKYGDKK